jgi:hypothetical protein
MVDNIKMERFVKQCKELMPPNFLVNVSDERIIAFIDLVIGDANLFPPLTGFTIDNLPVRMEPVVKFGVQIFSMLFLQMTYSLQDFDYNDSGLSIRLDRAQKIDNPFKNSLEMYKQMILNSKKYEVVRMSGLGLGSARFNTNLGGFIKLALGSSFNWNSPS